MGLRGTCPVARIRFACCRRTPSRCGGGSLLAERSMVISRACRSVGPQGGRCLIDGSDEYADYREQLVTWDEYARMVPAYAEQVSLPSDAAAFVAQLRSWLESIPRSTHQSFPGHAGVRIENGEPVLTKLPRKDDPAKLRWLEKTIADRRIIRPQPCNISKQATCSVSSASGRSDFDQTRCSSSH